MGALSFVIHVCSGISRNDSRRSTQTGLSTKGIRIISPGPSSPMHLPRRNTPSLWYSATILINAGTTSTMTTTIAIKIPHMFFALLFSWYFFHFKLHPVYFKNLDYFPRLDRLIRQSLPVFASHIYYASGIGNIRGYHAFLAHQCLNPGNGFFLKSL